MFQLKRGRTWIRRQGTQSFHYQLLQSTALRSPRVGFNQTQWSAEASSRRPVIWANAAKRVLEPTPRMAPAAHAAGVACVGKHTWGGY